MTPEEITVVNKVIDSLKMTDEWHTMPDEIDSANAYGIKEITHKSGKVRIYKHGVSTAYFYHINVQGVNGDIVISPASSQRYSPSTDESRYNGEWHHTLASKFDELVYTPLHSNLQKDVAERVKALNEIFA